MTEGARRRSGSQARTAPRDIELAAFTEVGRRELGLRVWHESREAAEQAWKDCRAHLRAEYGARNPHGGWLMTVLFIAVLLGAFAAVLASGFRTEPTETSGVLAALASVSSVADLIVLAVAGWRPLNWAAIRMQIGIGVTLGAAAAFQLSRPSMAVTPLVVAAGVIGLCGLALVLLVRAARPDERREIDTAINVAVARKQPEVDAIGVKIQARVLAELTPQEQERIVALRASWLSSSPSDVPAGGPIISAMLSDWVPFLKYQ